MISSFVTNFLSVGTILIQVSFLFILFLIFYKKNNSLINNIKNKINQKISIILLVIVFGGVFGSLVYSEIIGLAPCDLCWWIRVFLYPQLILIFMALKKKYSIKELFDYVLTLSYFGFAISLYQYISQMSSFIRDFGTKILGNCGVSASDPSCFDIPFLAFGYITIPMMSLTIFSFIIILVILYKKSHKDISK